jgi:hypothetical protein
MSRLINEGHQEQTRSLIYLPKSDHDPAEELAEEGSPSLSESVSAEARLRRGETPLAEPEA